MDGVIVKKLRVIPDERGWLMEILRNDDSGYTEFGQVYVTAVYDGAIKAWHRHDDPDEHRVDPHSLGYCWDRVDR